MTGKLQKKTMLS